MVVQRKDPEKKKKVHCQSGNVFEVGGRFLLVNLYRNVVRATVACIQEFWKKEHV